MEEEDYLARRARTEMDMSRTATCVEAARAHAGMARAYLKKLKTRPRAAPAKSATGAFAARPSLAQEQAEQHAAEQRESRPSRLQMSLLRN